MVSNPIKRKWGKRNVGEPTLQVHKAIERLKSSNEFPGLRFDVIEYYCNQFLFRCLPEEIEHTLSPQALKSLHPDTVKASYILLIRDLIRRFKQHLVPSNYKRKWNRQWVEHFTARLLELTGASPKPYADWITRHEDGEEEDPRLLIVAIAKQLGLEAAILWQYHETMCSVAEEDMLITE